MNDKIERVIPFLKWPGGKRWLVNKCNRLIPNRFNKYYEPFLGSGAIFFHLMPHDGMLSDVNKGLVLVYQVIRDSFKELETILRDHHGNHNKEYYYAVRSATLTNDIEKAAQFIYLNRTCFNGLYRVNRNGVFNVPIGTKNQVVMPTDNWSKISQLLNRVKIVSSDFESIVDQAEANDFIYIDPPYTIHHNQNSFIKYNEKLFSWKDQIRLAEALSRANIRGVKILATNAAHESIIDLYSGFNISRVSRFSTLSGKNDGRKMCTELLITNYEGEL